MFAGANVNVAKGRGQSPPTLGAGEPPTCYQNLMVPNRRSKIQTPNRKLGFLIPQPGCTIHGMDELIPVHGMDEIVHDG